MRNPTALLISSAMLVLHGCDRPAGAPPPAEQQPGPAVASEPASAPAAGAGAGTALSQNLRPRPGYTNHYVDMIGPVFDPLKKQPVRVPGTGPIKVSGFAVDAPAKAPAGGVDIVIDGVPYRATYGSPRPDVAASFKRPAMGAAGYEYTIPAGALKPGPHQLQVRIIAADVKTYYTGDTVPFTVE